MLLQDVKIGMKIKFIGDSENIPAGSVGVVTEMGEDTDFPFNVQIDFSSAQNTDDGTGTTDLGDGWWVGDYEISPA